MYQFLANNESEAAGVRVALFFLDIWCKESFGEMIVKS